MGEEDLGELTRRTSYEDHELRYFGKIPGYENYFQVKRGDKKCGIVIAGIQQGRRCQMDPRQRQVGMTE